MLFSAYSPLNGGGLDTYGYPTESPFDLDASLDYTRPKTGIDYFPMPIILGWIDGFVPLSNNLEYSLMLGKLPSGPWASQTPGGADVSVIFPNLQGGFPKVKG